MQFRLFGNTHCKVSEIGLGCWQLGADWGTVEESTAKMAIETAVDNGVTFFDTADVYGLGRSETLLRKYLRPIAPNAFIATKLGRHPEPGGIHNYSLKNFKMFVENSLKRLDVDALDLTQLHCIPIELVRRGEVFEWLRQLRKEGKIKAFGVSVESIEEGQLCLKQEGITSLQIIFNLFRQKPIHELFDDAAALGVALIIRLPLASGLLGGKLKSDTVFQENDHRFFNSDGQCFNVGETFAGIPFTTGIGLVENLKEMVPDGMKLSSMALRWVLDFDAVTVVIPGSKSPDQIRENVFASQMQTLPQELHCKLNEFYNQQVVEHIRGKY